MTYESYSTKTLRYYLEMGSNLTEKEIFVLLQRLKNTPLKDIGEKFGVGYERARQIEAKAVRKLLRNFRSKYKS